jgi:hypothetical protein
VQVYCLRRPKIGAEIRSVPAGLKVVFHRFPQIKWLSVWRESARAWNTLKAEYYTSPKGKIGYKKV